MSQKKISVRIVTWKYLMSKLWNVQLGTKALYEWFLEGKGLLTLKPLVSRENLN